MMLAITPCVCCHLCAAEPDHAFSNRASQVKNRSCFLGWGGPARPTGTLTGFLIVRADNVKAAVKAAGDCPILENEGTVEVAEMMTL